MTFEDRLLAELKGEVVGRARRRKNRRVRRYVVRHLIIASVLAGVWMSAAIIAPEFVGFQSNAYAVTKNVDGSITVTIEEMRNADGLERELAGYGVKTDITYLPQYRRCAGSTRGADIDDPQPPAGISPGSQNMVKWLKMQPATNVVLWMAPHSPNVFRIFSSRIKAGRTLIIELGESRRTGKWKLGSYLVSGAVRPCVLEFDPIWD